MPPAPFSTTPITEAVLEIKVNPPAGEVAALLSALRSEFSDFSESPERRALNIHIDNEGAKSTETGIVLLRNNNILQVRADGFAFSKPPPYLSWGDFQSEAKKLWERYKKIIGDVQIVRFGLRYINKIEISLSEDVNSIFLINITLPNPVTPQGITSLTTGFTTEFPSGAAARVMLHIPEADHGSTSVQAVLDIDAFQHVSTTDSGPDMWSHFEHLRQIKNHIFFNILTEKAQERYKA